MDVERWNRIQALFEQAVALPPEARERHLRQAVADDDALVAEVLRLLAHDTAGDDRAARLVKAQADELLRAKAMVPPGRRFGAWEAIGHIAFGGMGAVYRARRADGAFEQTAALKVLNPALLGTAGTQRLQAERQILAGLNHPCIARLLDGGTADDGMPFLVMEFVDGLPIDRYCSEQQLDTSARLRLFLRVCEAVDHAHRNLVVHRDIKPSNLLVTADGTPKLLDFGISKLLDPAEPGVTGTGERLLTPSHASPEQVTGGPITTATDVYGLGVLLYQLLAGMLPFGEQGGRAAEVAQSIVHTAPTRPSARVQSPGLRRELDGDLDNIVLMALRKEPARRYASVQALADDVRAVLAHRPVAARADTLAYRAGKFVRRHRVSTGMGVSALATLAALGFWHVAQVTAERDRAKRAEAQAVAEAKVARAVEGFMIDAFGAVSPGGRQSRGEATVRELLDSAVERLSASDAQGETDSIRITLAMARAYGALQLPEQTRQLAQRVLDRLQATGEQGGVDAAAAHLSLSFAAAYENRLDEAIRHGETAVALFELNRGPRSEEVARALDQLSPMYLRAERRSDQVAASERAHSILVEVAGPDALETLDAASYLAGAWSFSQRMEDAVELAVATKAGYERVLGPAHPRSFTAAHVLALTLPKLGRPEEGLLAAEQMLEVANAATAQRSGTGRVAAAHRMIYFNAQALGDLRRAFDATLAGIEVNLDGPAPDTRNLMFSLSNLAHSLIGLEQFELAGIWNEHAWRIAEQVDPSCGKSQEMFSYLHMYFAILARNKGDLEAARQQARLAVETTLRALPPTHPEVLKKRAHLYLIEARIGDPKLASVGLAETVRLYDSALGPDHPDSAQALGYLDQASAANGQDELAEEQFSTALQRLGKSMRDTNATFVEVLRAHVAFARSRRAAGAASLEARLADIESRRSRLGSTDLQRLQGLAARLEKDPRLQRTKRGNCRAVRSGSPTTR